MIKTVGLGQTFKALPIGALEAIDEAGTVVVQTMHSACAQEIAQRVGAVVSLDDLFDEAVDFTELYDLGAARIWELEAKGAEVCFCFLGDEGTNGFIAELKKGTVPIVCVGRTDPVSEALYIARDLVGTPESTMCVDARLLPDTMLDTSMCVVVQGIDNVYTAAGAKLALADYYADDFEVVLVRVGKASSMQLMDLDKEQSWGEGGLLILRALKLEEKTRYTFSDLVKIMEILRSEHGCPWDKRQTHESLRQYLIEEAYEVSDAVASGDMNAVSDELGDVLLQVVFHAEIGKRVGEFDTVDITTDICEKMIRRHPHVFGSVKADTPEEVLTNWDAIKKEEKGQTDVVSVLKDVSQSMSPLMRADKLQAKAARVGFDWPDSSGAIAKVHEELGEFETEIAGASKEKKQDEAGDLLFAVVNALRLEKIDPETALQDACAKFVRRFTYIEEHADRPLEKMSLEEMDSLWNEAKAYEKRS